MTSKTSPARTSATKGALRADATDTHVGGRMRERRLALGMSQTDLGNFAGISFQQIQKYERGVNRISISMLGKFAEALAVPVTYFLPDKASMGLASSGNTAGYDAGPATKDTREANELLSLFRRIDDPKLRKQVVELTKTLSKTSKKK